jgi:hypothetical protein
MAISGDSGIRRNKMQQNSPFYSSAAVMYPKGIHPLSDAETCAY